MPMSFAEEAYLSTNKALALDVFEVVHLHTSVAQEILACRISLLLESSLRITNF